MPKIIAVATSRRGLHLQSIAGPLVEVREITDDTPADVVGECVTAVIRKAWKAGFSPTEIYFKVRFE